MITLHHVPFSRSFRVLWLLEELGLDYEVKRYSIRDGSMRDTAFLKVSPAGRVPALEMGDRVLFESGAIVQMLCETYPDHGLAPAPGGRDRARFLECLGFAETMGSLIESLNLQQVFLHDPGDASPVVIKITTARLAATLKALERLLGDQPYLLKGGFSAADVMMGFNLLAVPYYVKLDGFHVVQAYAARIAARPAYKAALARDGVQDFYDRDFYPVPGQ